MRRAFIPIVLLSAFLFPQSSLGAELTIVTSEGAQKVSGAKVQGQSLWIPSAQLKAVTGFEIKTEGLCKDKLCIPLDKTWEQGPLFNLSAFASKLGQVCVRSDDKKVWSFSAMALSGGLSSGEAPNFTLRNRKGQAVSLSDFRGKKVLLLTWASW